MVLKKKNANIVAVQITKITNGSLLLEFNVILDSSSTSATAITTLLKDAITDGELASLNPDETASFSAKGLFLIES